jgi:hypothetical protein
LTNADSEDPDFESTTLPGLLEILEHEAAALEETVEALQQAQAMLSLPSPAEVAGITSGERPMSKAAYLLAQLQRHIVAVENVASDLRTDLDHGFDSEGVDIAATLFNALEAAIENRGARTKPT